MNMSTHDSSTLARRVEAGAEFLDAKAPGWYWQVNPERIRMSEGSYDNTPRADAHGKRVYECGCVLAQWDANTRVGEGRGKYNTALRNLGIYDMSADEYGFTILSDVGSVRDATWDELDELWKEAIEARREADDDNSAAWVR
jgi:hypothetical protein